MANVLLLAGVPSPISVLSDAPVMEMPMPVPVNVFLNISALSPPERSIPTDPPAPRTKVLLPPVPMLRYDPDRYSMAVPVTLDNVVVGVLDVQSDQVAGLKPNDETLLQSLAQQIAIAVRNARLFDETQMALLRAERLQGLYTGSAWEQFSAGRQLHHFEFREEDLPDLKQISTPEAATAPV